MMVWEPSAAIQKENEEEQKMDNTTME